MKKVLYIIIMFIFIINCSSMPKKSNDFFSKKDQDILYATTKTLGYDFGYDTKLQINYIFSIENLNVKIKKNKAKFNQILKKQKASYLDEFYTKIYKLFVATNYMAEYASKNNKWPVHNHLKNELLPALTVYMNLLNSYVRSNNKKIFKKMQKQKKEIKRDVILEYQTKHAIVDEY